MKFLAFGFGQTQTSVLGHLESKLVDGRSLSHFAFKKKQKNKTKQQQKKPPTADLIWKALGWQMGMGTQARSTNDPQIVKLRRSSQSTHGWYYLQTHPLLTQLFPRRGFLAWAASPPPRPSDVPATADGLFRDHLTPQQLCQWQFLCCHEVDLFPI